MPCLASAAPLNLCWRATFIDVLQDDCGGLESARWTSKTEPCLPIIDDQDAAGFEEEQAYVRGLAARLPGLRGHSPLVGCSGPQVLSPVDEGASLQSTSSSACGGACASEAISDWHTSAEVDAAASAPVEVDVAVQAAIRIAGHRLAALPCAAGELPAGPASHAAANGSVADTILHVKADALAIQNQSFANDASEQASSVPQRTIGSIGHPEFCNRPCSYFAATGGCLKGVSCDFCHLAHSRRPAHLDKRHRCTLRSMSCEECIAFVLPLVRAKVLAIDKSSSTHAALSVVFGTCGLRLDDMRAAASAANCNQRKLFTTLKSMNLKACLSSVQRTLSDHVDGIDLTFDYLFQHLRKLATDSALADAQFFR